ncbi:MAG: hypothetical protein IT373_29210 [Polyangiaceae bacterium]|nr:hypothetical protein [Polyangiaceae bacterium]
MRWQSAWVVGLGGLAFGGGLLGACSAKSTAGDPGSGGSGATGGSGLGGWNVGGSGAAPAAVGHIVGTVYAPEGTIPISGALLYLSSTPPPAIPDGVYCDQCVTIDSTTPNVLSAPDGTFVLPAYVTGPQYLVVQKGQFRRVRQVDVVAGNQAVAPALTTMPGAMDKANGDDTPKMAIVVGAWDDIGASLGKLGLEPGSFDLFQYAWPPDPASPWNPDKILHDPAVMNRYHIVFMPCDSSDGTTCAYSMAEDAATHSTLAEFVGQGGKIYVTDYSYDYIREVWPEYLDWVNQTAAFGSACLPGSYTAPAVVNDSDMSAWLAAQGITSFALEANWTMIDQVHDVPDTDPDGNPITVTPKVWVSGQTPSNGVRPTTVSFERGCGRVLYSTYHTEGTGGGFLPQEKALLYVLLEVAVCVGQPIPN